MGRFPEPACPRHGDCAFTGFEGLTVEVDGEPFDTLQNCPALFRAGEFAEFDEEGAEEEMRDLIAEIAEKSPAGLLRRCRNAVYARHGCDFDTDELGAFFYETPSDASAGDDAEYRTVGFRKNSHFAPEMAAERDRRYAELIKRVDAHLEDE